MVDYVAVLRRAIAGLNENTPEMREKVYKKARGAVLRQLSGIKPPPPMTMLQLQLDKLEAAILELKAEEDIEWLDDSSQPLPEPDLVLPDEEIGPTFEMQETGLIALRPTYFATDADRQEMGMLLSLQEQAVNELLTLTSGSNSHNHVHVIAEKYKTSLTTTQAGISIETLFFHGIRLQNAVIALEQSIDMGDDPSLSAPVAECLKSVVAIHGPLIMSTTIGRDLVAKAKSYAYLPENEERYRVNALQLAEQLRIASILESASLTEIKIMNEEINKGPDPRMSNSIAHTANANLIKKIAKLMIFSGSGVATLAFTQSKFTAVPAEYLTNTLNAMSEFFSNNPVLLRDFAAASGSDLSWLPSFMNWAERQDFRDPLRKAVEEVLRK